MPVWLGVPGLPQGSFLISTHHISGVVALSTLPVSRLNINEASVDLIQQGRLQILTHLMQGRSKVKSLAEIILVLYLV